MDNLSALCEDTQQKELRSLNVTLTFFFPWCFCFYFLSHYPYKSPHLSQLCYLSTWLSLSLCLQCYKESELHDGSRGHTHHSALADIHSVFVEEGNTIGLLKAIHHARLSLRAW